MNVFYNPQDVIEVAAREHLSCGHAALAAALRIPLSEVVARKLFNQPGRAVSDSMMRQAIRASSVPFERSESWPEYGVMQIQFLGPWMNYKDWHPKYAKRHWVASQNQNQDRFVWDINFREWLPYANWSAQLERDAWPAKCTGVKMLKGFDLLLTSE